MGQGHVRLRYGSGETQRTAQVQGAAQTMDRRTHLRLAQLVQTTLERLRITPHIGRNHDLHRLRTPTAQTFDLVFGQALRGALLCFLLGSFQHLSVEYILLLSCLFL